MIEFTGNMAFRDIALISAFIAIIICIEFSIFFLNEWYKKIGRKYNDLRLAWSIFLLSIGSSIGLSMISDFYTSGETQVLWVRLGFIVMFVGIIFFSHVQEKAIQWKTHNILETLGVAGIVLSVFLPHNLLYFFALLIATLLFVSLLLVFSFTIVVKKRSGNFKKPYTHAFIFGFAIMTIGYALKAEAILSYLSSVSYTIGVLFMTVGLFTIAFFALKLPSFKELDWPNKIYEILFVHNSGKILIRLSKKCLPKEDKKTAEIDNNKKYKKFFEGAIHGIKELVGEITSKKENIKVIDSGDVKIIFGHSHNTKLLLLVEEVLQIYKFKINEFIKEYNALYSEIVYDKKTLADTNVWKPAEEILKQIFEF